MSFAAAGNGRRFSVFARPLNDLGVAGADVLRGGCVYPTLPPPPHALLAELVDATDLKSVVPKRTCRFESGRGHQPSLAKQSEGCRGEAPSAKPGRVRELRL